MDDASSDMHVRGSHTYDQPSNAALNASIPDMLLKLSGGKRQSGGCISVAQDKKKNTTDDLKAVAVLKRLNTSICIAQVDSYGKL